MLHINLALPINAQGALRGRKVALFKNRIKQKPADGVSVDQIISAQPGLIPQMAGILTSKRIWGCTTFVDHVSNYIYVHLMKELQQMKHYLQS